MYFSDQNRLLALQVDSHLLLEERMRWLGEDKAFSFPTDIPHVSVGYQSPNYRWYKKLGIPSYDDIFNWELGQGAEEEVGRSRLEERPDIERGGKNLLGGWLELSRGRGGKRGRRRQGQ